MVLPVIMDGETMGLMPASTYAIFEEAAGTGKRISVRKNIQGAEPVFCEAYCSHHHDHIEVETIPRTYTSEEH